MLVPTYVNIISFFYPIGNTPAVCLTQDLPYEQAADVLLLGCGDVRNILFTIHSDSGSGRNILLLTLLIDDADGVNNVSIWNIYYHLFLDSKSMELLQTQSRKLHSLAASIQSWQSSAYGRVFRFSDHETLKMLRSVWHSYCVSDLTKDEKAKHDRYIKLGIQKAKDMKRYFIDAGPVFTGIRSAAPISVRAVEDLPRSHQYFWDHGITDEGLSGTAEAKHCNPMFASLATSSSTLHYGTDPLLGFHLATAYAPLAAESPLRPRRLSTSRSQRLVEAARIQFQAWATSFRTHAVKNLTLRFFVGDALAYCHTLQHMKAANGGVSAHWYRGPYTLQPLALDGDDYKMECEIPLSFDTIDTSNLVDHLGALNVLTAASPLLKNMASATLYTELLVKREKSRKELIDRLLCGHFPTISIMLGLIPVEYWTGATAISSVDEGIWDHAAGTIGDVGNKDSPKGQMHSRLAWKRSVTTAGTMPTSSLIQFNEDELAHLLHRIYREMFKHENMTELFSNMDLQVLCNNSCPRYHRGSLASLLLFIKRRVSANWEIVMDVLLALVINDATISMGMNYLQEFYVQLHLLKVHSVPSLGTNYNRSSHSPNLIGTSMWSDLPPVVCITLRIPRNKLGVFTSRSLQELGTPIVHCILQSASTATKRAWQNIFGDVHLAFGELTTSGLKDSNEFKVHIAEDEDGWMGTSPLLASFYVPSWIVLLEPQATSVAFGIQGTPQGVVTFAKSLGLGMNVYSTSLRDDQHVYITRYLPNQSGYASVCDSAGAGTKDRSGAETVTRTTITASVDRETGRIIALTGRVDNFLEDVKLLLNDKAAVEVVQASPFVLTFTIGRHGSQYHIQFPAPIVISRCRTRIARKSSYVEIVAPLPDFVNGEGSPHFMYPVYASGHSPVVWNMPYSNLECLPILDTTRLGDLQWLITHTSLQFSAREKQLRERWMLNDAEKHKDVRVNFKDSLFSMFMHFSGLQGGKASVFGINHPTGGGVHILIFVSSLRLDLANHTVVLDSAILPLSHRVMPQLQSFLTRVSDIGLCSIIVDDDELRLWKEDTVVDRKRSIPIVHVWERDITTEFHIWRP
ncbi:hypothetical protein LTR50_007194 [Elasticomyces elasticus]|nr:hypothetical protein LTR50_007194 [Elasticomyces elasticus]